MPPPPEKCTKARLHIYLEGSTVVNKAAHPVPFLSLEVHFGDVWLCTGQSNMALSLSSLQKASPHVDPGPYENLKFLQVFKSYDNRTRHDDIMK